MSKIKYKINLNNTEKEELEKILKEPSTPQFMAKRVRVILMANSGKYKNVEISKYVGMNAGDITKWTQRWVESEDVLIRDSRIRRQLHSHPLSSELPVPLSRQAAQARD